MSIIESLLQELEQEAQITRRVLERVPEKSLQWKPHEKSMSLGQLALHIATTPGGVAAIARQSPFHMTEFAQSSATSAAELLNALEQSVTQAKEILRPMEDADLQTVWRAVAGETEVVAMPVGALLRTVMLNHWYHHRGQLTVYLRQLNVPVPSVYGPSADENPFVAPAPAPATAVA